MTDLKQSDALSLPKGWEVKKLDDLCQIELGKTPYRGDKSFWDTEKETENVWLSIADMLNTDGDVVSDSKEYITDKAVKISKVVKEGTLLLSFKLTLGRLAFAGKDLFTNEAIAALTIKNEKVIDKYFLYQFLSLFDWNAATEGDVKVKGKTLNKAKLKEIEVHFPKSLHEQQRIVAILDKVFAAIATAKANAEHNLNNAKELFESYLQSVFDASTRSAADSEGWEERTLKEITTKIGSGATPRGGNKSYKTEGISLIRSMNVHDFEFRERNLAFIDDQQAKELNNVTLQEHDVLLNITGASVARCCVIPKEYLPARVNQHVSIIRAKQEIIDPIFLNLLLVSNFYKDQLLFTGEQGATRQAITKAQIEVFNISFPPLHEQQIIVRKFDALRAETKKLEAIYQQKINDLEELKQSVLRKAFTGKLL